MALLTKCASDPHWINQYVHPLNLVCDYLNYNDRQRIRLVCRAFRQASDLYSTTKMFMIVGSSTEKTLAHYYEYPHFSETVCGAQRKSSAPIVRLPMSKHPAEKHIVHLRKLRKEPWRTVPAEHLSHLKSFVLHVNLNLRQKSDAIFDTLTWQSFYDLHTIELHMIDSYINRVSKVVYSHNYDVILPHLRRLVLYNVPLKQPLRMAPNLKVLKCDWITYGELRKDFRELALINRQHPLERLNLAIPVCQHFDRDFCFNLNRVVALHKLTIRLEMNGSRNFLAPHRIKPLSRISFKLCQANVYWTNENNAWLRKFVRSAAKTWNLDENVVTVNGYRLRGRNVNEVATFVRNFFYGKTFDDMTEDDLQRADHFRSSFSSARFNLNAPNKLFHCMNMLRKLKLDQNFPLFSTHNMFNYFPYLQHLTLNGKKSTDNESFMVIDMRDICQLQHLRYLRIENAYVKNLHLAPNIFATLPKLQTIKLFNLNQPDYLRVLISLKIIVKQLKSKFPNRRYKYVSEYSERRI